MPPDQVWRYVLGTIALFVAFGMAIAACFGAGADAGTYKTQILGAKVEGSSIVVLAIVVFVAAAAFLMKASKETAGTNGAHKGATRHRPSIGLHGFMAHAVDGGDFVDEPPPAWLRPFLIIVVTVTAIMILVAAWVTTHWL